MDDYIHFSCLCPSPRPLFLKSILTCTVVMTDSDMCVRVRVRACVCVCRSASGIPSDIRVHDLKEDFAGPDGQWNVRYVEMVDRADDGSQSVLIRYNSVDDCNAASAITELRSTAISCEVAGGDLEAGFWKRAQESADRRAAQGGGFGGGGRGGGNRRSFGRGGGGGNRRGGGRGGGGNRRGGGGGRWRR